MVLRYFFRVFLSATNDFKPFCISSPNLSRANWLASSTIEKPFRGRQRERYIYIVETPVNLNNTRAKRMRKLVNRYPLCNIPFLPQNLFPSPHSVLVERLSGSRSLHGHRERREYHRRRARERETRLYFLDASRQTSKAAYIIYTISRGVCRVRQNARPVSTDATSTNAGQRCRMILLNRVRNLARAARGKIPKISPPRLSLTFTTSV